MPTDNPLSSCPDTRAHARSNSAAAAAILTYSDDGSIRLWNDRGQLLHVLDGHSGGVKFATFNRTGTLILAESNQARPACGTAMVNWSPCSAKTPRA
ncbi:MAG: hypothetical protein HZY76_12125 [Anaerolineae bacterium]|nr:MAG: hypothetical protein HZY76_12125 [Anaerolineae bacterium]